MITECESCLMTVMARADGSCPACGSPVRTGRGSGQVRVVLWRHDPVPDVCLLCGGAAQENIPVVDVCDNPDFQPEKPPAFAILFNLVAGKMHRRLRVEAPLCRGCLAEHGNPKPLAVDHEAGWMAFRGHPRCRAAAESLRRSQG